MAQVASEADRPTFVLLDRPGWRLVYADERSRVAGITRFESEFAGVEEHEDDSVRSRRARLSWYPAGSRTPDEKFRAGSTEVMGVAAGIYDHFNRQPWPRELRASWQTADRDFEFDATTPDIATFQTSLASLRVVDAAQWISALPISTVIASATSEVAESMLDAIPLPPGFDPRTIEGLGLAKDRYQLGAAVSRAVACSWFATWADALDREDSALAAQAVEAMATAKDWPVLQEMDHDGDWPWFVERAANQMPGSRDKGHALLNEISTGLGCERYWRRADNGPTGRGR